MEVHIMPKTLNVKESFSFFFYRYCCRSCLTMMEGMGVANTLLLKKKNRKQLFHTNL